MASPISNAINATRGVPLPGGVPPMSVSPANPAPWMQAASGAPSATQPILQPYNPNPYSGITGAPGVGVPPADPGAMGNYPAFGTRGVGPVTLPISRVPAQAPPAARGPSNLSGLRRMYGA